MLVKIIHGIVTTVPCSLLASTKTRSQQCLKIYQIPASSDYYKFSFFPRTIRHWNSLPASMAEAPSLVQCILQTETLLFVSISYPAWPCKYTLVIFLRYAVGDSVAPGTHREGSVAEG